MAIEIILARDPQECTGGAKAYFTSGGDDEDEDEDDGEVHEHTYESTEDNRDESTHTRADV